MDSIVASVLTQSVSWKQKTGEDKFNQPTYAAPVTIAARKRNKTHLTKDATGKEVVSSTIVITQIEVKERDQIDGEDVISIDYWRDLDGAIIGYKSSLGGAV